MHNYLDSIINYGGIFPVIPQISSFNGISWTIDDFMKLWETGFLSINPIIALIIGIMFILGFIFIFILFLIFLSKKTVILTILYIAAFMFLFFLLGSISTGEHSDAGAILYIGLFWLAALVLCVLSIKDFNSYTDFKINLFKSGKQKLVILSLLFTIVGLLGVLLSIFGFIFNNFLVEFIIDNYSSELSVYIGGAEISFLTSIVELLILIFSIINLICALGLLIKNKLLWKFTVYYQLFFSWTVIGLTIACALSENSIKRLIDPNIN